MSDDLISVIIPVYNGEKFIEQSVNSILNSTYKNLEILLIDDGSTDKSKDVCEELSKKNNRVKVFSKENEGIAKARNFALKRANGKYICFSDQDDIVPDYAYEVMKKDIEENNADLCIGKFEILSNKKTYSRLKYKENFILEGNDVQQYLIEMTTKCRGINYCETNKDYVWTIWNNMYKSEIIKKYNIEIKNIVNYEDDFLFNFDYIKICKKIIFEKKVVYYWKKNLKSESNSKKYVENLYENRKKIISYLIKNLNDFENFDEKKWKKLSNEKNFVNAIINEANDKNKRSKKESLEYLNNLYINDVKMEEYDFKNVIKSSLKSKLTDCTAITYKLCQKGKYKVALYIDRYLYYKVIFKILNLIRKIVY